MRSAPYARKSRWLYICLHTTVYLIFNHIFVCINHWDTFNFGDKWYAQRFIGFTYEKLKLKVQTEDGIIYIWNKSMRPRFNFVFDLQINNSEIFWYKKGVHTCIFSRKLHVILSIVSFFMLHNLHRISIHSILMVYKTKLMVLSLTHIPIDI